jgi:hypothetical protein
MRCFFQIQRIRIHPNLIEKARIFAEKVIRTVDYRDSNQFNAAKIQNDHFVSKIGEEATRRVFEYFGKTVEGPDYGIYHGSKKSWDHDLSVDHTGLAVKTQKRSAAKKYGLSWTFQSSGIRRDPILQNPDAWVCFVEFNDKDPFHECFVFPPYQIRELTFKDPVLPHLKNKKRVVYAADLPVYTDA